MEKIVRKYIGAQQLIPAGASVLVALSGGADSVALLRILLALGYTCRAAHCNFRLRGAESVRDETFVRELCRGLGVPLYVKHFDTAAFAESEKISVEMAARKLRYDWFGQLLTPAGAEVVAVAHHRDDSVETVLLNLIRGTGIGGLRGIRPRNGTVVRPFLCVGRKEILDYLECLGQAYVTDSTNLEDAYVRNKIRLNILPSMETINPSASASIAATASRLDEAAAIYEQAVGEAILRVKDEKGICIPALLCEVAPRSVLFEILYPLGFNPAQVESVFDALQGEPGRRFYAMEWSVLKDRDYLILRRLPRKDCGFSETVELPVSGEIAFGTDLRKIRIGHRAVDASFTIPREKAFVCLDAAKLAFPLTLRRWRHGDRFKPFGMKGMKKVSDYLTDRKFSLDEKEHTYVVCSGSEIAWIVGERSDERFRIDSSTREAVLLGVMEDRTAVRGFGLPGDVD